MKDIGIDISGQRSKSIDEFTTQSFDYVITVCEKANQHCPTFAGAFRVHWGIQDPASVVGEDDVRLQAFRSARDDLRQRIGEFGKSYLNQPG